MKKSSKDLEAQNIYLCVKCYIFSPVCWLLGCLMCFCAALCKKTGWISTKRGAGGCGMDWGQKYPLNFSESPEMGIFKNCLDFCVVFQDRTWIIGCCINNDAALVNVPVCGTNEGLSREATNEEAMTEQHTAILNIFSPTRQDSGDSPAETNNITSII